MPHGLVTRTVVLAVAVAWPARVRRMPVVMLRRRVVAVVLWRGLRLLVLLPVRPNTCRDLAKDLLQPHLVPRKPLDVVEGLDIYKAVRRERCQRVKRVIPSVCEVGSHCRRYLVRLEEVDDLVTFSFQVRIHLPDRSKTMQVLRIVLAEEIHDKVDAILGLLILDLLREPREELRDGRT